MEITKVYTYGYTLRYTLYIMAIHYDYTMAILQYTLWLYIKVYIVWPYNKKYEESVLKRTRNEENAEVVEGEERGQDCMDGDRKWYSQYTVLLRK